MFYFLLNKIKVVEWVSMWLCWIWRYWLSQVTCDCAEYEGIDSHRSQCDCAEYEGIDSRRSHVTVLNMKVLTLAGHMWLCWIWRYWLSLVTMLRRPACSLRVLLVPAAILSTHPQSLASSSCLKNRTPARLSWQFGASFAVYIDSEFMDQLRVWATLWSFWLICLCLK